MYGCLGVGRRHGVEGLVVGCGPAIRVVARRRRGSWSSSIGTVRQAADDDHPPDRRREGDRRVGDAFERHDSAPRGRSRRR